jgi:epoxide hydrolase-like predicted phosphatase
MTKIKSIVFDWGGVLIEERAPSRAKMCIEALKITKNAFLQARIKHLPDFDTGKITEAVFWERMAQSLNVPAPQPPTLWGDVLRKTYSPRPQVFSWAEELHQKGYTVGLLSNTEPPGMEYFIEQNYTMFDFTVFSCAEGFHKPDSQIYEKMIQKTKVLPQEVLFLDDKEKYVQAARQLNIESHKVQSARKIKEVLLNYNLPIS